MASQHKIEKFIFSSSYEVYSTNINRDTPLKEEDALLTDSLYGYQKRISEEIIKRSNLYYTIFRLATVYGFGSGVGTQWAGIVGQFIRWASQGKPLLVYGNGTQKIDFIHIDDVTNVFQATLLNREPFRNKIFNLGSGEPLSIINIANKIKSLYLKYLGKNVEIKKVAPPPRKIWPDKWLSIDKLKKNIKKYPNVSIDGRVLDMILKYERIL